MRSPSKRLHVAESAEREGLSLLKGEDVMASELERLDLERGSLKEQDEGKVEYARSRSLPARELVYEDDESHSQNRKQNGNETAIPDRSCSDSAIAEHEELLNSTANSSQSKTSVASGEKEKDKGELPNSEGGMASVHSALSRGGNGVVLMSPELEVPRKFDFAGGKGDSAGDESTKESNNDVNDRGNVEEGVFVFTATNEGSSVDPASPDYVKSKRKSPGVHFNLSEGETAEGERRDEMATLAQQLELGGSDNVRIVPHLAVRMMVHDSAVISFGCWFHIATCKRNIKCVV